jgi:hypothetical protein
LIPRRRATCASRHAHGRVSSPQDSILESRFRETRSGLVVATAGAWSGYASPATARSSRSWLCRASCRPASRSYSLD